MDRVSGHRDNKLMELEELNAMMQKLNQHEEEIVLRRAGDGERFDNEHDMDPQIKTDNEEEDKYDDDAFEEHISRDSDQKHYQQYPHDDEASEEEFDNIDEDQMIEIAQKCFLSIAEHMIDKKLTIKTLYHETIFSREIDAEEIELISPMDFINGIRSLGIEEFQTIE